MGRRNNASPRFAGMGFVLFGILFAVAGVRTALLPSLVYTDSTADAKVVAFETEVIEDTGHKHSSRRDRKIDVPVYEFVDRDGVTHRVCSKSYSSLQSVQLGDVTTIDYDSGSPEVRYTIASEEGIRVIPLVAGLGAGVLCSVVGVLCFNAGSKRT